MSVLRYFSKVPLILALVKFSKCREFVNVPPRIAGFLGLYNKLPPVFDPWTNPHPSSVPSALFLSTDEYRYSLLLRKISRYRPTRDVVYTHPVRGTTPKSPSLYRVGIFKGEVLVFYSLDLSDFFVDQVVKGLSLGPIEH